MAAQQDLTNQLQYHRTPFDSADTDVDWSASLVIIHETSESHSMRPGARCKRDSIIIDDYHANKTTYETGLGSDTYAPRSNR